MSKMYELGPGDTIVLPPAQESHSRIPDDIHAFLMERGWQAPYDTYSDYMYEKNGVRRFWSEAMAIEFYNFITLGGR